MDGYDNGHLFSGSDHDSNCSTITIIELFEFVMHNDLGALSMLLQESPHFKDAQYISDSPPSTIEKGLDSRGLIHLDTLLMTSCRMGRLSIAMLLVTAGCRLHDRNAISGYTALMYACECNQNDTLTYLIGKGVRINDINVLGMTSLMLAVRNSHVEIVSILLRHKVNVDLVSNDMKTALLIACQVGFFSGAILLMYEGNRSVNHTDIYGNSALGYAAAGGFIDIVHVMLLKNSDVHLVNKSGRSPLMLAAKAGNVEVCSLLIKEHVKVDLVDIKGDTALTLALKMMHIDVCAVLIKGGADLYHKNNLGLSALDLCGQKVKSFSVTYIAAIQRTLLDLYIREQNWKRRKNFALALKGIIGSTFVQLNSSDSSNSGSLSSKCSVLATAQPSSVARTGKRMSPLHSNPVTPVSPHASKRPRGISGDAPKTKSSATGLFKKNSSNNSSSNGSSLPISALQPIAATALSIELIRRTVAKFI